MSLQRGAPNKEPLKILLKVMTGNHLRHPSCPLDPSLAIPPANPVPSPT